MDRHAIATALARDDKAAVDCHADKSARNDNENAANKKVDSRGFD
ncbi:MULTISPECIES: hypothetical protein [Helicobacter]|uniref:Uncharacterized protein n=1 Tax=Helicobacter zhangjianzhongii TaxID=2974574 RepID=A0ACC6FRL8_9HELI|nr:MULTISPECIES: hypothetical protein [Helicobacter]MDL0080129.1 hypothetical protein [Helicobacter sp. CPD2-1]MDL0081918.1 hypothetical protein [Helicobacter sp. XJK30-2]